MYILGKEGVVRSSGYDQYWHFMIICRRPYSVEDLQVIDLEFFNSLKYVLDNDPEPLALTFAIEEQSFGVVGVAVAITVVFT